MLFNFRVFRVIEKKRKKITENWKVIFVKMKIVALFKKVEFESNVFTYSAFGQS